MLLDLTPYQLRELKLAIIERKKMLDRRIKLFRGTPYMEKAVESYKQQYGYMVQVYDKIIMGEFDESN